MARTVLVLNNPSSISILFTTLRERVDEIWVERGASDKFDRGIGRSLSVLGIDRELPVRQVDTINLFEAGRQRRGKVRCYRQIAGEIDEICRDADVVELICSTTSAFRLARVPRLHVVDHGAGDYLRSPARTRVERLKYAWLYSGPARRTFRYYAFLPLSGRIHMPIEGPLIRERVSGLAHPFALDRVSVILLVYPTVPLEDQLQRLHATMAGTLYDVYLKGHHFDPRDLSAGCSVRADRPTPRMLPDNLDALPAELLVWGFDLPLRLSAYESTTLWHIGAIAHNKLVPLAQRDEILALPGPYASGLSTLEKNLGYSPYL